MDSERTLSKPVPYDEQQRNPPPSRLLDEKISDDSGTEAKTNSPLAPAGLKNPFWK